MVCDACPSVSASCSSSVICFAANSGLRTETVPLRDTSTIRCHLSERARADEDNIHIATVLAAAAETVARAPRPRLNSPADIPSEAAQFARILTAHSVAATASGVERSGWDELVTPRREG